MAQLGIAREGDMVTLTCTAHRPPVVSTVPIVNVSGGFLVEGKQAACLDDTGSTNCDHSFRISFASSVITGASGKKIARVGDAVEVENPGAGVGVIVSGSTNVTSE